MELTRLIEALSKSAAYPGPAADVEVRHTHISVVFLVGDHAYKIKKPVNLGFLDFSTLDMRHHFCQEEVRLNRRLAPAVYVGVVPINQSPAGVKVEGPGSTVEWAVKMKRLTDEATLERRLLRGEVDAGHLESLARKVATFHAAAEGSEHIASFGRFDVVARNARENFAQAAPQVSTTVTRAVLKRLQALTEEVLTRQRPLIESRAERGVPRDTHGDLHLDHVYLFPERPPPDDLVIIDCIEFNERFRYADPVADMAFLVMDLAFHGRRDLARRFADEYFRASGDTEGPALLPLYTSYRAAVRGKVEGFELQEKEIPQPERSAALARARAHWLLALGELESPVGRPCLVLVGGLPGTGKSTLARGLVERAGCTLVRSDVVRKQLAGLAEAASARSIAGEGIYAPAWTARTYDECLRRAEALLLDGKRVVVDATFSEERRRREFLDLAARLAVPAANVLCQAEPATVRQRLEQRRGDASDADWSIYEQAATRWEETSPSTQALTRVVETHHPAERTLTAALHFLRELALLD
jgi:aminoglycoside phosphotransferase family enzyme/predicted kinase